MEAPPNKDKTAQPAQTPPVNVQIEQRKQKLAELRKEQSVPFPNDFQPDIMAACIHGDYEKSSKEDLDEKALHYKLAGRMMLRRIMGKASFCHLQDMTGRLQIYVRRDDLPEGIYAAFKSWDLGDIIGVEGRLFRTKTGELSLHATNIRLLTKSLRPLPDKFHGVVDQEIRYRQRYLDLIMNESTKKTFIIRAKVIAGIRQFLLNKQFMEVETPMMQVIPGGAAAKPFITHHNALDQPMYLRIAPELYLKRLVVGGFDRVFEINRNFRNEGLSTQHNPEFTMLEFYQAYANYHDLMDLTEALFRQLADDIIGAQLFPYQDHEINVKDAFERLTLEASIIRYTPDIKLSDINTIESAKATAKRFNVPLQSHYGLGKIQMELFDKLVEHQLIRPTFITEYPAEVSPLARANDQNPFVTDRFELFIAGREIANGFSELNDAQDQAKRFQSQVDLKSTGDEEAMFYDEDYVRALEYGLPPTAGEGIGIDRLVMLFTNAPSIRDVILFPQMRKETIDTPNKPNNEDS